VLAVIRAMKQLTPEVLREATQLITDLRGGRLDDEQQSSVVDRLNALLLDPRWFSYTVDYTPELSPEQVVRRAFEYRPFAMPATSSPKET
jgi:hypothetical protein